MHRHGRGDRAGRLLHRLALPLSLLPLVLVLRCGERRHGRGGRGEGGPPHGLDHEAERGGVGHDGVDPADDAEGVGHLVLVPLSVLVGGLVWFGGVGYTHTKVGSICGFVLYVCIYVHVMPCARTSPRWKKRYGVMGSVSAKLSSRTEAHLPVRSR